MEPIDLELMISIRREIEQICSCMEGEEYIKASFNIGGLDRHLNDLVEYHQEILDKKNKH